MSQLNQDTNCSSLGNLPVKRKRGRPRKDENLIRGEKASVTPRSDIAKRNRPRKTDSTVVDNATMVGQPVSGVLEESFDAGYVLTVRVGNINKIMRGVVFKPGLSVPITGSIDVAPNVKMFKRNESFINIPSQVHGSDHQLERKNEPHAKFLQGIEVTLAPKVSQVLSPQVQSSHPMTSKGVPIDINCVPQSSAQTFHQAEARKDSSASILDRQTVKSAEMLKVSEDSSITKVSANDVDEPKDSKLDHEAEPSFVISQGNQTTDRVPQVRRQVVGSELKPDKGQVAELNHTPVAAASQTVTTQLIVELSKMLQENRTLRQHDTPRDMQSMLRDESSHLNENPLSEAVETTQRDSQSELKINPPAEVLKIKTVPYAQYDSEAYT